MWKRSAWTLLATIILTCARTAIGEFPATSQVSETSKAVIVKAPTTPAEIATRRAALVKEITGLLPTTLPATTLTTQAATQPAGVAIARANDVLSLLIEYDRLLDQQEVMYRRIAEFKSDRWLKQSSDEIGQIRDKCKELESLLSSPPRYATEEELKQARELYEKLNQEYDLGLKAEVARGKAIAEYPQRRKEVASEVSEAQKLLDKTAADSTVKLEAVQAGPGGDFLRYERRLAELRSEMALSKAAGLAVEETLANFQQQQEQRRLEALQGYVKNLRLWVNILEKAHAAGELGRIEWELGRARQPYEKKYWQAALELLKAQEFFLTYDNPTRDRFPESKLAALQKRISQRDSYWQIFLESLSRREGAEVLAKYKEIRSELAGEEKEQDRRRRDLYLSIDERQVTPAKRDEVLESAEVRREELAQEVSRSNDKTAAKLEAQLAERRLALVKRIDAILTLQDELTDRLKTAVEAQDAHIHNLDRYRSRLYWAYLMVRDQGVVWASWHQMAVEFKGGAPHVREAVRSTLEHVRVQVGEARLSQWAFALLVLCVSIPIGLRLRRRFSTTANSLISKLNDRIEKEGIEVADTAARIEIALLKLVGEIAPVNAVALAILASVTLLGLRGLPWRIVALAAAFVFVLRLSFAIVGDLFMVTRPRFRVIRCSNKVAGYYRRWLRAILYLLLITVPLPVALFLLDVMPITHMYLWQVSKSSALIAGLLFLIRKQLVLKVVGRPEELRTRWLYLLVSWCYPLIPVGVLVLLGLELFGYGALVTYVIAKTGLTLVVFATGATVSRYVTDYARRYKRRLEQQRPVERAGVPDQAGGSSQEEQDRTASKAKPVESEEESGTETFLGIVTWLSRWSIRIGCVVAVLRIWGITLIEINDVLAFRLAGSNDRIVTFWRVLLAVTALWGVVLVSRSLRSVLQAKVYPEYPQLDRGSRAAINTLLHYALLVIGAYIAFQLLHLDLGALTVLMGTLGLGLGLGLQPLFINFISGLIILFERHIKLGDIVEVGDKIGEVTRVSMRSTSIRTYDNVVMVIPNSEFITSKAVNWSNQDKRIRGQLDVGVAYGTDVDLVRQLLLQAADEHPLVLKDPEPMVWFTSFGDNAMGFKLLVWFSEISPRMAALTDLRCTITKLFAAHGIVIPFPQRTISLLGNKPLPIEIVQTHEAQQTSLIEVPRSVAQKGIRSMIEKESAGLSVDGGPSIAT